MTVTAAAFALEAWSETIGTLGSGVVAERNDHVRIVRTLEHSCHLDSTTVTRWTGLLSKVFQLRHAAVHPATKQTEPNKHPSGLGFTSFEAAAYTVEAATRAVDAMLEVLDVGATRCAAALPKRFGIQDPNDANRDLRNAVEGMTKALVPLRALRQSL